VPGVTTLRQAVSMQQTPRPSLLLATNNPHKIAEMRALLHGCGWDLITPEQASIAIEPEESGDSYAENARIKAVAFASTSGLWALADDSGLEVDALDGAPGVHSARYAGAGTSHAYKVDALLAAIATSGVSNRAARFRAVFTLASPDGKTWLAEGVWNGAIAEQPRGIDGFGYDPIFIGSEDGRTAAELTAAEKNAISHRARAAAELLPALRSLARIVMQEATVPPQDQSQLSHIDAGGQVRMVDVSDKERTERYAIARGRVTMRPETLMLIEQGSISKGNVLTTAQIAGILAAKRTHELIPMCHPLLLTGIDVSLTPERESSCVEISARVRTTGQTGVEMEALTAVSVAALTIYDMCKAVDRGMRIEDVRLAEKHGGKSGDIVLE